MQLDKWQVDFIACKEDKVLVAGRQTGKSEAQAYDCGQFAIDNPGTNTLIVSKTERQAQELIIKVLSYLQEYYPGRIGKGEYKPLKGVVWIMHGKKAPSRVMAQPIGLGGEGVRGYTLHKLVIDEAQLPTDEVFVALAPMLLVTNGKISLSGTPQGKKGFFWKAYENKSGNWRVFHVNSEEVIKNRPISSTWQEWQRVSGIAYLAKRKAEMSAKHYAQEYLGQFIEDLDSVFSEALIAKTCVLKRDYKPQDRVKLFLGVDVGRVIDPSTFEILDGKDKENVKQIDNIVRYDYSVTKTADECIGLEKKYKFIGIGVDGGGMGAGVVDILLNTDKTRLKVKDLNNSRRAVEWGEKGKKTTLLKEDMYRTLQIAMEKGHIKLLDDEEVKVSLRSVQIEYIEGSNEVKIYGSDTHVVEGIIRALYLIQTQALNIWAR